jgi:DNA-binding MarR family transcriptional regulator
MQRKPPFLPAIRELVRTYQAFESYSASQSRSRGLTPCQFDIIATLGNTDGMNFKKLGEKTLITKGTLTGVVDRLEASGLVRRVASLRDRRSQTVQLTEKGEALFNQVFPEHIDHMALALNKLTQAELDNLEATLQQMNRTFVAAIKALGGEAAA